MKQVVIFLLMNYNNEVPVKELQASINQFYSISVQVRYQDLPAAAYYKPRNRYNADYILSYLHVTHPNQRVIALTSKDICKGKNRWGVIGLGSLKNDVCITSTHRIKNKNLKDRLIKVLLHEIGHSYGIEHCTSGKPCFMVACKDHKATSIDAEPMTMCNDCKLKKNKAYVKLAKKVKRR